MKSECRLRDLQPHSRAAIDTDSLSFINKDSEANNVENDFLAALNSVSKEFGAQKDGLGRQAHSRLRRRRYLRRV